MSEFNTSDSILVDFPPSMSEDQIQILPEYSNITTSPLLTAPAVATAYNIPASTGAGVKVGIISLGGGFSQTDLNRSMSDLGLTAPTITFVGVDGATNNYDTNPANTANYAGSIENTLDLVCVAGMVPGANIILYKGNNSGIYYNTNPTTANALNNTSSFGNAIQKAVDDNCDVITVSWGTSEKYSNSGFTYYCGDYLNAPLSNALAKGISVFVSAGDYGSEALPPSEGANFQIVSTDYPSVNPNVVAVGGTNLTLSGSNTRTTETVYNNSEAGHNGVGGGGGVSSMITIPAYQSTASISYKTYPDNVSHSLNSYRGIPDVSTAMNAYGMWFNGTVTNASGTSASAPIMAGIVARFISLNGGRRPPQPLNKIFYNNANAFYDISSGNNASYLSNGYTATTGWDATTGWGSIANGVQLYQNITTVGMEVKTSTGWNQLQAIKIKTGSLTWTTVDKVWTKTSTGWVQTY